MEGGCGPMDLKIKTSNSHPYRHLEDEKEWGVIANALKDLTENNDLITKTSDRYIVGYLVKRLKEI